MARVGGPLRWAALLGLALVALAAAAPPRRRGRLPLPLAALGAALGVLALLSAVWSVTPRLTAERALTFLVALAVAAALGVCAADDPELGRRVLLAVAAAAGLVALGGLVLLLAGAGEAAQQGEFGTATRLRGLGQNPNTIPMLAALALPACVLALLRGRRLVRAAAVLAIAVLALTIALSGSRGGLAGGVAALVPAALLLPRRRLHGAALACAVLLALGLGVRFDTRIIDALRPAAKPAPSAAPLPSPAFAGSAFANPGRLEDELGRPRAGGASVNARSGGSGRTTAWRDAIRQGDARPAFGYGFGTEDRVFVDREYFFQGGRPENSFVGMYLQLGLVGVAALVAFLLLLAPAGWRAVARRSGSARELAVVGVAMVLGGVTMMVVQSYVYSVGNVATLSFWVGAALVAAVGGRGATQQRRRPRLALLLAAAVGLAGAVGALGAWERDRAVAAERARLDRVFGLVGGRVDAPSLVGFRLAPSFDCLLYRMAANPYQLELCFDAHGRLVEAIDRRGSKPRFATLRYDPAAASRVVSTGALRAAYRRLGVFQLLAFYGGEPLYGSADSGPYLVDPHHPPHVNLSFTIQLVRAAHGPGSRQTIETVAASPGKAALSRVDVELRISGLRLVAIRPTRACHVRRPVVRCSFREVPGRSERTVTVEVRLGSPGFARVSARARAELPSGVERARAVAELRIPPR